MCEGYLPGKYRKYLGQVMHVGGGPKPKGPWFLFGNY